jgi:adenylate cyclase
MSWKESVRRTIERVRVAVTLTDAARATVLWSEKYDADLKDVLSVQDQITQRITGALAVRVSGLELAASRVKAPVNQEAYDLVLRGRDLLRGLTRSGNIEARHLFEHAVELDPSYPPAYVGLGRVDRYSVIQGWTQNPTETLERAEGRARKAIALDDLSPGAHALLGQILLQFGDHDGALHEMQRAIAVNPSDPEPYGGLVQVLLSRGDIQEAIKAGETLIEFQADLNPPDAFHLATAYVLVDRSAEAIRLLQQSFSRNREEPNTNIALAAAYSLAGRRADADQQAQFIRQRFPWFSRQEFGALLQRPGQREKLRLLLRDAGL